MRIICIEEHYSDATIEDAARENFMKPGSFLQHVGNDVTVPEEVRPQIVSLADAAVGGADVGDGRIAEMDRNAVSVQILAPGNTAATQYLPPEQAAELVTASNDSLAGIVRSEPSRAATAPSPPCPGTIPRRPPPSCGAR